MLNNVLVKEGVLIRRVEETLLHLFSLGKLNGTIHTCIGQEFSAISFATQLKSGDIVFSNHRCHGHYISYTKDYKGLILELLGKENGVCGGIGGSQHLHYNGFYSNGIQGGIVAAAAGLAFGKKLKGLDNIGVVFIGDGTLGEGILYETMNIISKWNIPLLIVCENNFYAQSTRIQDTLAGNILARPEAFDIKTFKSDIWNVDSLYDSAKDSIEFVRRTGKPAFHLVEVYRLNAHSKGDDDRGKNELERFREKDPLNIFSNSHPEEYQRMLKEVNADIDNVVNSMDDFKHLSLSNYMDIQNRVKTEIAWSELEIINERMVTLINNFFKDEMKVNDKIIFIGEDVLSPYGGAFKVAKDLSSEFPDRVFTTPISEAAIVGISNGLALGGFKPFVEIMFGDFTTLVMDQIINHASKFHHMYNKQAFCPIVIRTPMGGGRGYGPTHSQTLDKFLIGIDNITTIALNILINPALILKAVTREKNPVILIENKLDYGKTIAKKNIKNFEFYKSGIDYPIVKISPKGIIPNFTLITYGGNVSIVLDAIERLFYEFELLGEVLILSQIFPLAKHDLDVIYDSVKKTKSMFVVEEGSGFAGFGSELISQVAEAVEEKIKVKRITSLQIPIPSSVELEKMVLVSSDMIVNSIKNNLG